jgi:Spy/CpxP family protein refolding chaperone
MVSALFVTLILMQPPAGQHVHPAAPPNHANVPTGLSEETVRQLLAGEGMGLAKPAEMNMFPGPKHVLELKKELAITPGQEAQVTAIRERMLAKAQKLGREIVEAERALDAAFKAGTFSSETLSTSIAAIGRLQAELRTAHLQAHLETKPVLTPAQIHKYYELRGGAH